MIVDLRVSKTNPRKPKVKYGQWPSTCPVRTVRAWLTAAGLDGEDTDTGGYLFRRLHPRWHTVSEAGLTPESIGDVITRLGAWGELDFRPTGHSPRRGGADSSRRAKNDRSVIADNGGWVRGSRVMERYFETGEGWEENAMNGVL